MSNYDPRNYGAVGDGIADDTEAVQSAIDAATAAGGGTVTPEYPATFRVTRALKLEPGADL